MTDQPEYGSVVSLSAQEARRILETLNASSGTRYPDLALSILDLGFRHQFDPDAVGVLEREVRAKIDERLMAEGSS